MTELQKNLLPELLRKIPDFGVYTIHEVRNPFPPGKIITPTDIEQSSVIQKVIKRYEDYENKRSLLEFLVHERFALKREDLTGMGKFSYHLTDKGRELKDLGSLDAYKYDLNQKKNKIIQEEKRNRLLYRFTILVGVSAIIEAVFTAGTYMKERREDQLETQLKNIEQVHERFRDSVFRAGSSTITH